MQQIKKITRALIADRGFTIMELVIVLVVMGIIFTAIMPYFQVNVDNYTNARFGKDLLQSTRIGWNRMMEELKEMEGPEEIDRGEDTAIQFDIPGNSNINYDYNSTYKQLEREGVKLIWGVQSFNIEYYDKNGSLISTPFSNRSDVWRLKIQMEVGYGDQIIVFTEGQICPRNFFNY